MNLSHKNLAILIVIMIMMIMMFRIFKQPERGNISVSYSDFLTMVEGESVMQVTIQGDNISGTSSQGPFKTFAPKDPELIK
ncbi:MAG: ATP-dependent metallopeptidase FtsH/Yme1/Tma family protein, partial [Deltaproteobacteria bacterium]|nr:ATP-dependent metallopeptidase FtsH/Yme1/Tma family protein [Deltaproteobacteria bacterium]